MDTQQTKDEIARMRAEAKGFRDLARGMRQTAAAAKTGPIGSRDMLLALKCTDRANEYTRSAQERDGRARELRAQL